jgi:CheY-like chemotaxis protein
VFFSVSGEETIALFTQNQPDIVLLDINLNDKINGKDTG